MIIRNPAKQAARRRGELHRDGGDPRVSQAIAARGQLDRRPGRSASVAKVRGLARFDRRPLMSKPAQQTLTGGVQ
jgi:hypothetical protein